MRKKMIWGSAILIILLIGVSAVLLMRNTDTEPEKVYKDVEPSKEVMDSLVKRAPKQNKPPRAARDGFKWEWHGDHWHEVPKVDTSVAKPKPVPTNLGKGIIPNFGLVDLENPRLMQQIPLRTTNVAGIDIDWVSLSPSELAETIAKLERQEISAPNGYYYRRLDSEELHLDENGYPIIHKDGESRISVIWEMAFRSPPDVFEVYQELSARHTKLTLIEKIQSSPEITELESKMAEMKRTYQGPLPLTYFSSGASPKGKAESRKRRADSMIAHVKTELIRQMGFEHLIGYY
ncbi:hypothetical protein F4212_06410 [Candidatus Poribacteria bacterium]|nr:hypothetical protein [Candidatus Poribacteria bacterium]